MNGPTSALRLGTIRRTGLGSEHRAMDKTRQHRMTKAGTNLFVEYLKMIPDKWLCGKPNFSAYHDKSLLLGKRPHS